MGGACRVELMHDVCMVTLILRRQRTPERIEGQCKRSHPFCHNIAFPTDEMRFSWSSTAHNKGRSMDAKDCRQFSKQCIAMANLAPDGTQAMLFSMATGWLQLAENLDADEAFRERVKDVKILHGTGD
jgi:hypothetical protein